MAVSRDIIELVLKIRIFHTYLALLVEDDFVGISPELLRVSIC